MGAFCWQRYQNHQSNRTLNVVTGINKRYNKTRNVTILIKVISKEICFPIMEERVEKTKFVHGSLIAL
jgi:hypothetical protein